MPDSHETLKAYIQKVLDIQDPQREQLPTQDELKALALEMGLDMKEWEALQKTFADHLTRGKGFVKYENWDDAIDELQQACAINPSHPGAAISLAHAYRQRGFKYGNQEDLDAAEKYARLCLKINPSHDPALQLLSNLKGSSKKVQSPKTSKKLILFGLTFGLAFTATLFYLNSTSDKTEEIPTEVSEADDNASTEAPEPATDIAVLTDLGVDVEFLPGQYEENIQLIPYSSDFSPFEDSYSYKLLANLKLSSIEMEEINLKVELLDPNDQVILTDFVDGWASHNPKGRSGDLLGFGYQEYQKTTDVPEVSRVRLSVHQAKAMPGADTYEPSPEIPITWVPEKPANVDLIVRKRLDQFSENITGRTYNKLAFEVENIGNTNIKKLKFQLQWYDKQDELIDSKNLFIVSGTTPPLLRGQVRLEGGTYSIKDVQPQDIKELEIVISDIDY